MGFWWARILQVLLPSIPEIISTVRDMQTDRQAGATAPPPELLKELEQLEREVALQARRYDDLATRVQLLQQRMRMAIVAAIIAILLAVLGLGVTMWAWIGR
jgi:hypothetical protein